MRKLLLPTLAPVFWKCQSLLSSLKVREPNGLNRWWASFPPCILCVRRTYAALPLTRTSLTAAKLLAAVYTYRCWTYKAPPLSTGCSRLHHKELQLRCLILLAPGNRSVSSYHTAFTSPFSNWGQHSDLENPDKKGLRKGKRDNKPKKKLMEIPNSKEQKIKLTTLVVMFHLPNTVLL